MFTSSAQRPFPLSPVLPVHCPAGSLVAANGEGTGPPHPTGFQAGNLHNGLTSLTHGDLIGLFSASCPLTTSLQGCNIPCDGVQPVQARPLGVVRDREMLEIDCWRCCCRRLSFSRLQGQSNPVPSPESRLPAQLIHTRRNHRNWQAKSLPCWIILPLRYSVPFRFNRGLIGPGALPCAAPD